MRSRQGGAVVFIALAVIAVAFLVFCLYALKGAMTATVEQVEKAAVTPPAIDAPFVRAWSTRSFHVVHEMALTPDRRGEFIALNAGKIIRIDATGNRLTEIDAPPKSTRIATDPTGGLPHVYVVSRTSKWTGAIDHTVTTGHFLHAMDLEGRQAWTKRFEPKDVSTLEPLVTRLNGRPVVVLSASQRIICMDGSGTELWNLAFSHHPGSVTPAALTGGGLLAARVPMREIVLIGADGTVVGPWGMGEGPSRVRTIQTRSGMYGISIRHATGRGPGGRHVLAFFDGSGTTIREVDLPPGAGLLSYSPIGAMDVDGTGRRNWVVGLNDGTMLVYSPAGYELARHASGSRLRTLLAVPQPTGPDLLIAATHGGLTAWWPVSGRFRAVPAR
jgi:hypothetical protein